MKYALIPVLNELSDFMLHQSDDEEMFLFDMGCDTDQRNEALSLLHRVYFANTNVFDRADVLSSREDNS